MTGNDPLNNEVSVSAELTPTGVTARAKSRFLSGIDRLGGNLTEWVNVRMEAGSSLRRAKTSGEVRLIEAAAQYGIERLGKDAEFAERALQYHFQDTLGKHANREAVIDEAIADLRRQPPTEEQSQNGSEEIDPVILDRIAEYAGGAWTDALREKWGRVLAAEVREQGQFSLKVLRIVDELEPETAKLFERVCRYSLGQAIPVASVGELSFSDIASLDAAGLMIEPGLGHTISAHSANEEDGTALWLFYFFNRAVAVPQTAALPTSRLGIRSAPIQKVGEEVSIPVYTLTKEGIAVKSILPDHQNAAVERLIEVITAVVPEVTSHTFNTKTGKFEDD